MNVEQTSIDGLLLLSIDVYGDARGFFVEQYEKQRYGDVLGQDIRFVQDNLSRSDRGVLRGLHYQKAPHTQGKLISVLHGSVFDVAVDIRKDSPTFGAYVSVTLSAPQQDADGHWQWKQFWIPEGFAHGFLALEDQTLFSYKCSDVYAPESDAGVLWSDPAIGIAWPEIDVAYSISEKDQKHPLLQDIQPL